MSELKLPVAGLDLSTELSIAQFTIAAGAGATFSAANNIGTITFNAAHTLTLSPAAGVPPNYFITFGGSTSGVTGTGVLVGNVFRILTIPTTTAITIYTTITAAVVTSLTGIPVFYPPFTAGIQGPFSNGPSQVIATAGTYSPPQVSGATVNFNNGANCAIRYNPDQLAVPLDGNTGSTPAVAPTWRDLAAVSTNGQAWIAPPWGAIWANGSTATSRYSVIS